MAKKARPRRSVKFLQDALVTEASAEAATDDGDGGRVLERLDKRRKKARQLLGPELEAKLFQAATAGRHAEPEPEPVAASAAGASARVRELPPSTGGAVPAAREGGRPGAALQSPRTKEWPASRRARIRNEQRRSKRARELRGPRMVQLFLPGVIRTMDLEPMLRGAVIEALAAVLLRPWDRARARSEALEEA